MDHCPYIRTRTLFLALLAAALLPLGANAYATEEIISPEIEGDFVVGPGIQELVLKPGETGTAEILVTNRMGVAKTFKLEVEDFTGSKDPNTAPVILLGRARGPYSLKDYIRFETSTFTLRDNMRARIPITITLPKDAEPGGRYGSVIVSTISDNLGRKIVAGAAVGGSVIETRVGNLFFIRIPGLAKLAGQLRDFRTVNNQWLFTAGPIKFNLLFENTGNIHLSPRGEIVIDNIFGQRVSAISVEPWFSLPDSLRLREVAFAKSKGVLIGRYAATAKINRGYSSLVDIKTLYFWVIPWKLILIVLLTVAALVTMAKFVLNRFEIRRK